MTAWNTGIYTVASHWSVVFAGAPRVIPTAVVASQTGRLPEFPKSANFLGSLTIFSVDHRTPGNKRGSMQTRMKNLKTGAIIDYRFRAEEFVDRAILDEVEFEYLYNEGDEFHFMNTKTYEQMHLTREQLGETVYYLIPNTIVKVEFFDDRPIGVDLPDTMELKVIKTEPTLQKATASAVMKPATLETGLVVQVPPFVNQGDRIKVDTTEARYVQRVE